MDELLSRTGRVAPAVSATERGTAPVRAISEARAMQNGTQPDAQSPSRLLERERSSAAADYARIHADIADVLADLKPPAASSASAANDADRAIVALMPSPVVMLPLPPTDTQMVAFVAQVAQSMARQAAQARAAHAVGTPIMIEAAAH